MTIQTTPLNTSYSHNTTAYRNQLKNAKTLVDGVRALCNARRWTSPQSNYRPSAKSRAALALAWPDSRVAILDTPRISLLNSAISDGWRVLVLTLEDVRSGHAEELLARLLTA